MHWVSKFGTMSMSLSVSSSLLYTEMYNIQGGSCWTDQALSKGDDNKPLKVDMVKYISSPKGKDNPLQRQRVCFKHTHIFFRQWKCTPVEGDSGVDTANLMLWQPWTAYDVWACPQQNSLERKTQTLRGFPLWLGKRAKQSCPLTSILMMYLFSAPSRVRISLIFVAFCCFAHGKKNHTYYLKWIPSKNMCNIHTVSPLNCTEKIKMFCFVFFISKWTFEKVQIKTKKV